jgi:hypothetical protein
MGIGRGSGDKRALDAVQSAISSPLLDDISIDGATGILVNVTGGPSLTLHEVNEAIALITDAAHEDANIIFGYVVDETMGDDVAITVIATGFERARRAEDGSHGLGQGQTVDAQAPQAAQQRIDADVPTYIRNGWKQGKHLSPAAEAPQLERPPLVASASLSATPPPPVPRGTSPRLPFPSQEDSLAIPRHLTVSADDINEFVDVDVTASGPAAAPGAMFSTPPPEPGLPSSHAPLTSPRRPVVSVLPPLEEESAGAARPAARAREPAGSQVTRQAAQAMNRTVLADEEEYDIPAFLRRGP